MNNTRRLYRSRDKRMFSGVCGGLGEYFGVDPTVIRLVWVVASIFPAFVFGGLVAYIICAFIIPEEPA